MSSKKGLQSKKEKSDNSCCLFDDALLQDSRNKKKNVPLGESTKMSSDDAKSASSTDPSDCCKSFGGLLDESSSNRDVLIETLQCRLKSMEDLYKKSLNEQEYMRRKYGDGVQNQMKEANGSEAAMQSHLKDELIKQMQLNKNPKQCCKQIYEFLGIDISSPESKPKKSKSKTDKPKKKPDKSKNKAVKFKKGKKSSKSRKKTNSSSDINKGSQNNEGENESMSMDECIKFCTKLSGDDELNSTDPISECRKTCDDLRRQEDTNDLQDETSKPESKDSLSECRKMCEDKRASSEPDAEDPINECRRICDQLKRSGTVVPEPENDFQDTLISKESSISECRRICDEKKARGKGESRDLISECKRICDDLRGRIKSENLKNEDNDQVAAVQKPEINDLINECRRICDEGAKAGSKTHSLRDEVNDQVAAVEEQEKDVNELQDKLMRLSKSMERPEETQEESKVCDEVSKKSSTSSKTGKEKLKATEPTSTDSICCSLKDCPKTKATASELKAVTLCYDANWRDREKPIEKKKPACCPRTSSKESRHKPKSQTQNSDNSLASKSNSAKSSEDKKPTCREQCTEARKESKKSNQSQNEEKEPKAEKKTSSCCSRSSSRASSRSKTKLKENSDNKKAECCALEDCPKRKATAQEKVSLSCREQCLIDLRKSRKLDQSTALSHKTKEKSPPYCATSELEGCPSGKIDAEDSRPRRTLCRQEQKKDEVKQSRKSDESKRLRDEKEQSKTEKKSSCCSRASSKDSRQTKSQESYEFEERKAVPTDEVPSSTTCREECLNNRRQLRNSGQPKKLCDEVKEPKPEESHVLEECSKLKATSDDKLSISNCKAQCKNEFAQFRKSNQSVEDKTKSPSSEHDVCCELEDCPKVRNKEETPKEKRKSSCCSRSSKKSKSVGSDPKVSESELDQNICCDFEDCSRVKEVRSKESSNKPKSKASRKSKSSEVICCDFDDCSRSKLLPKKYESCFDECQKSLQPTKSETKTSKRSNSKSKGQKGSKSKEELNNDLEAKAIAKENEENWKEAYKNAMRSIKDLEKQAKSQIAIVTKKEDTIDDLQNQIRDIILTNKKLFCKFGCQLNELKTGYEAAQREVMYLQETKEALNKKFLARKNDNAVSKKDFQKLKMALEQAIEDRRNMEKLTSHKGRDVAEVKNKLQKTLALLEKTTQEKAESEIRYQKLICQYECKIDELIADNDCCQGEIENLRQGASKNCSGVKELQDINAALNQQLSSSAKQFAKLKDDNEKLESLARQKDNEINQLRKAVQKASGELESISTQRTDFEKSYRSLMDDCNCKFDELKRENENLNEEMDTSKSACINLKEENKKLKQAYQQISEENDELRECGAKCQAIKDNCQLECNKYKEESKNMIKQLLEETDGLKTEKEELEKFYNQEICKLDCSIDELQADIGDAQKEVSQLKKDKDILSRKLKFSEEQLAKSKGDAESGKGSYQQVMEEKNNLEDELRDKRNEINQLQRKVKEISEDLDQLQKEKADAEKNSKEYSDDLSGRHEDTLKDLQQAKSSNDALSREIKQCQRDCDKFKEDAEVWKSLYEKDVKELQNKLKASDEELLNSREKIIDGDEQTKSMVCSYECKLYEFGNKCDEAHQEISRLKGSEELLQKRLADILSRQDKFRIEAENWKRDCEQQKIEKERFEAELSQRCCEICQVRTMLENVTNDLANIKQDKAKAENDFRKKICQYECALEELSSAHEIAKSEILHQKGELSQLTQENQKLKQRIVEKDKDIDEMQNTIKLISKELDSMTVDKAETERNNERLICAYTCKIDALNADVEEARTEIQRLKDMVLESEGSRETDSEIKGGKVCVEECRKASALLQPDRQKIVQESSTKTRRSSVDKKDDCKKRCDDNMAEARKSTNEAPRKREESKRNSDSCKASQDKKEDCRKVCADIMANRKLGEAHERTKQNQDKDTSSRCCRNLRKKHEAQNDGKKEDCSKLCAELNSIRQMLLDFESAGSSSRKNSEGCEKPCPYSTRNKQTSEAVDPLCDDKKSLGKSESWKDEYERTAQERDNLKAEIAELYKKLREVMVELEGKLNVENA